MSSVQSAGQTIVNFLTQDPTSGALVTEQGVYDFLISKDAQTTYTALMSQIQHLLLDGVWANSDGSVKTDSNGNPLTIGTDSASQKELQTTLQSIFAELNAWANYKSVTAGGTQTEDATLCPTSLQSSPSTMSRYMASALDTLNRTLDAAGLNPWTMQPTSSSTSFSDVISSIRADDTSSSPTYNIRSLIASGLSAAAGAMIIGDTSTQSQSIQQLLMVDYVTSGNEILYGQMSDLQTAIDLNQKVLSYLNSLQDLMNQKSPDQFLMQLSSLNQASPDYSAFERATFGNQVIGTTPNFTDAEIQKYLALLQLQNSGQDISDPLVLAEAQIPTTLPLATIQNLITQSEASGVISTPAVPPISDSVMTQNGLTSIDKAIYDSIYAGQTAGIDMTTLEGQSQTGAVDSLYVLDTIRRQLGLTLGQTSFTDTQLTQIYNALAPYGIPWQNFSGLWSLYNSSLFQLSTQTNQSPGSLSLDDPATMNQLLSIKAHYLALQGNNYFTDQSLLSVSDQRMLAAVKQMQADGIDLTSSNWYPTQQQMVNYGIGYASPTSTASSEFTKIWNLIYTSQVLPAPPAVTIPASLESQYHLSNFSGLSDFFKQYRALECLGVPPTMNLYSILFSAAPTSFSSASATPLCNIGSDSVAVLLNLQAAGLMGSSSPISSAIATQYGLTSQDQVNFQAILILQMLGLDPSSSSVQTASGLSGQSASITKLLSLQQSGVLPTNTASLQTTNTTYQLTTQDWEDYIKILTIQSQGLDPTDAAVQSQYSLTVRNSGLAANEIAGTSPQAFIDIVSGQYNGSGGIKQIEKNLQDLINLVSTKVDPSSGSSVVTELALVLQDFKAIDTPTATDPIGQWVANFANNAEGSNQAHLNDAVVASQSLNDTQREKLQMVMFVYQQFYQSATSMLSSLTTLLQTIASNISR